MKSIHQHTENPRRAFLGKLAAGAIAVGTATLPSSAHAASGFSIGDSDDPEAWLSKIKGKHRISFDVTGPNEIMPFAWPRIFLVTNGKAQDCGVVVILRHNAIPYAMGNDLWEKYKFGEAFKIDDPKTKSPSTRNPFWQPQTGDFTVPGIGNVDIGINQLQSDGVLFCVCNMALTVFSTAFAGKMNLNADDVKKEWLAGILPGVQVVPSGVWAVGRVQEHGCSYCFAG
ncbi:MAG TPA: twin-arginine translocation signal domain-containing protein [Puia sp.]|nr:twin-arginine translocation signal domain-containing protein [Puia sp.]